MSEENNINMENGEASSGGSGEPNPVDQAKQNGDNTAAVGANDNKGTSQKNKRINRNNNRRQKMYNNVQSLFSNSYQSYDLRNMLGPSGAWYHQPQRTHFKKPRTNNNKQNANKNNDKTDGPIDDVANPLKCAVTDVNYPQTLFTEEEFNQVQGVFINKMLETQDSVKFHSCLLRHGAVLIHCFDEPSKNWLFKIINDNSINLKLKIGLAKDLILTGNVTLTVPKLLSLDNDQIMKLLKCQNPNLRTELWQVLESKSDETDNQVSVAIDDSSFKAIKSESYQAYLGLGMVKFSNSQYYNVVTYNSAA